ncbi:Restriction endonuclease [Brevibacterium sp. 239c]|uniref:restriction endonuclease n=1 Tax=Brevibacterium sp. 239c TaxID=1965356 RepID=UPI000C64E9B0|nr:restriction endonuclease [Brevibacterium sp. 239c]SMX98823.1 Restriction endonuclease [Brevibacterium sp. 239c]
MNKRLRKNIIEFIATSWPLDAAPRALEDVLYELATQNFNTPETAAAEFSEEDRNGALEELNSILVHTENEAIPCRFSFNENSNDHIQGSSFIQKSDNDATRRAKTRRLNYDAYHLFLKNLQWREFEACCRGVLEHLGCASPRLTAHSSDQGIDFFGRLSLRDRLGNQSILPSIDSMLDIWLIVIESVEPV